MNQILSVLVFNNLISFGFGFFLALVGLVNKYSTKMKYVYRSVSTWVYLLLASAGSLLFTTVIEVIGARLVENALLNSIVLGIIGPTVFLGVVSRLPPPLSSSNEIETQLKTLYDYVFNILDASISRKTTQTIELKIRDAGKDADLDSFLREVDSMLDAVSSLTGEQKDALRIEFDKTATRGEYAPIIRELIKYYDVDYIIKRLSFEYERKQIQSRLRHLIHVALDTHKTRNSILPEFIIAKVQALQKDPDGTLYYLEQAIQKNPSLKKYVTAQVA